MLVSTILVILMTIPGLALFYGGLVRAKNMLSVLMQVLAGFCMIALLWVIYGYSLAFTGAGTAEEATALTPFIGGLSQAVPRPASARLAGRDLHRTASTFPNSTFVVFQLTFAAITPALIVGAIAERMKLRRGDVLPGALVHLLLPADRPHGLVVGRPERCRRAVRLSVRPRRATISPAAPWCTSMPVSPASSRPSSSARASAS